MVKVGFICEGKIERKIVQSDDFKRILSTCQLELVEPVIDAEGAGNLLPNKLVESIKTLKTAGADKIIILTDLDKEQCISNTKSRISNDINLIIIVAVKQIESWFLADNNAISNLLGILFYFEYPENEPIPYETLRSIFIEKTTRGIGDKDKFAGRVIRNGFSIESAANHPNCPSAKYFLTKLQNIKNLQS